MLLPGKEYGEQEGKGKHHRGIKGYSSNAYLLHKEIQKEAYQRQGKCHNGDNSPVVDGKQTDKCLIPLNKKDVRTYWQSVDGLVGCNLYDMLNIAISRT
jgi:hypothetical protein